MTLAPAAIFKTPTESPQPVRSAASRARKAVAGPPKVADALLVYRRGISSVRCGVCDRCGEVRGAAPHRPVPSRKVY